jgi:hypothetical protein
MQAAGQSTSKVEEKDEPASNEEEENWKKLKNIYFFVQFYKRLFPGKKTSFNLAFIH